jgi:hypothetical protein
LSAISTSGFSSTAVASSSPVRTVTREETPSRSAMPRSMRAAAFAGVVLLVKTTLPLLSRVRTSS